MAVAMALPLFGGSTALAQDFTNGGKYYLKNECGRFLGAGNSWGTQASLLEHPEYVILHKVSSGVYQIESRASNGGTAHYFTGSYMDGEAIDVTFTALGGGKYTLSNGTSYYGYDGSSTILASNLSASAANARWEVLSEAEMVGALSEATPSAPLDATFFIKNHNFSNKHRDASAWTMNASNQNLCGGDNNNKCAESWHSTFTLTQTLTNLPTGVYTLSAQAFYRQDGSDNTNLPVIYAGDATSTFLLRTGGEDNMNAASKSFLAGNYKLAPAFVRVENGTLNIGARLEGNTSLWCIFDHFVLTYYGDCTINEAKFAGLIAQIQTLKGEAASYTANVNVSATIKAQVSDEIAAADNELANTSATEASLQVVIDNLNAVISAANSCIPYYEYLARELTTAASLGVTTVTEQQTGYDNGTYDEAGAIAAAQAVNVATYNKVKSDYPYPYALDAWTGEIGTATGQHWSGDESISYYDKNGTNITLSLTNTVTLPAGDYVLKAAGRSHAAATMVLDINGTKVTFTAKGDTGFGIDTNGDANFSADGTYANGGAGRGWEWQHLHLNLTEETTLTLKATITTSGWAWGSFSDITLQMGKETFENLYYSQLAEKLEACKPWVNKGEYATTTYPAYQAAYDNKTYTTKEEIEQAMTDLQTAYDAYVPFAKAYEYLARELATANSLGVTVSEQQTAYDNGTYDEAGAIAAAQAVNVATYNKVKDAYPYALDAWTGEIGDAFGQHWSGNASTGYHDTNGTNITRSLSNTVTLPAGDYVLRAAGRSHAAATMVLDINGEIVTFRAKGDTGFGIDTNGDANFSADGTYATDVNGNNNSGCGWEWEHLRLNLTEETTLTLKATITTSGWAWGSFSDITLQMDEATYVTLRYPELGALLEECKPLDETSEYATVTYPAYQAAYNNKTYTTKVALESAMAALQEDYTNYLVTLASPEHPVDITAQVIKLADCTDNGDDIWAGTGRPTTTGEHWSGDAGRAYFRQNVEPNPARVQAITLPYKGVYLLKSSVRVCDANSYAAIAIDQPNDEERFTMQLGRTGGTIATDGTEWPSVADGIAAGKTFANNNNGFGWYYNYLYFAVLDDAQMSRSLSINLSHGEEGREANCGGMTLYYLGEGPVVREVDNKTVHYGMYPANSSIELTAEKPVADLRRASVTGATVTATNPNGLVFANSTSAVSTTNNVVVNGTCAKLSLTDGHAFVSSEAFTATAATYTLPAVATAADGKSFGTLCLPFEVTAVPGKAYTLDRGLTVNDELYGTEVTTIPAGTPVLVTAKGTYTGSGNVAATNGGTFQSGELVGTYNGCTAPVSSYVLQKHSDKVAFYLVGADVQPTVKPFRAYIAPQANNVRMLNIALDGELTGIESTTATGTATITACYDAQGRRIAAPRRGLNILHMSDGTIQKVIIK